MQFFRGNLYDRFDFYGLLWATSSPCNDESVWIAYNLPSAKSRNDAILHFVKAYKRRESKITNSHNITK